MKRFFKLCTSVLIMIVFITTCYAEDYNPIEQELKKGCDLGKARYCRDIGLL